MALLCLRYRMLYPTPIGQYITVDTLPYREYCTVYLASIGGVLFSVGDL